MPMNPEAPNTDPWMALAAAGLGAMASRSPFAGVALGEGGLQGLQTFQQLKNARLQERDRQIRQQQVEQQAKRLEQMALQQQRNYELGLRREDERQRANDIKENREVWRPTGQLDEQGRPILMNNNAETKVSDIKTKMKLSASDQKAIRDAEGAVKSNEAVLVDLREALKLNPKANYGPMADKIGYIQSITGFDEEAGIATETFNNLIQNQALGQLKTIFGAAPTEGERKILLELQASTNKAPKVREEILNRAIQAAEKRLIDNKTKAAELKNQEFYKPDDQKTQRPQTQNLKPANDAIRAVAKKLLEKGYSQERVIEEIRNKGFDPSGL